VSVSASIEVNGVRDVLKTLRQVDPELRKEFNRNARTIVKPIMDDAKRRYTVIPLSGFRRRWAPEGRELTPKPIGRWRSGVTFRVNASKKQTTVFVVKQVNPIAAVFDKAGKQLGANLAAAGWGQPSRVMWPAYDARIDDVRDELVDLITEAADRISRKYQR
jgi:hypothetical protein